ncbi:hypothetical protein BC939DRAFT_504991 [Gamsiella multidivaricata]|uniref:uncharacterized protein n=1 Tax=Gamsiella multidivaricata TaxID=101098 RepID=UPI00221E9AB2|nr:uncharacterized protein BC939DRAFT_504991 [Gamsiella multidivaricata]KAI7820574.1 hypothetical protein BC939DRAFT_504991 [Gamsiella multidivaricata]
MTTRSDAHQAECRLPIPPCQVPAIGAQFSKHNFLGHVCRLMHKRQVAFRQPSAAIASNPLVALLLPPKVYHKVARQLAKDNVSRLRDVTAADGTELASWDELRRRLHIKGRQRQWYVALRRHACVPPVGGTPCTGVEEDSDEYTDDSDNMQTQPGQDAAAGALSDDIPRPYLSITPSSESEDESLVDPRARRRAEAQARVTAAGAEENNFYKPPGAIAACYDSNRGD